MDDSSTGYYSWASSSSEAATFQGPLAASPATSPTTAIDSTGPQHKVYFGDRPVVEPPRSRGATDMSESRRSSGYTQTNAESTTATNTPSPHPRSDANGSSTKDSSKTCKCCSPTARAGKGRNLVICIDGTSNKCGIANTNVIELYSQILKDEDNEQLTYYDSGIGTYATPTWKSWSHLMRVIHNKIDLVIAWNLEKVIIGAYQWLSNQYRPGDKIFLFGFSRGAYQVRALAGMVKTVGLLLPGNESQIPFAYQHYVDYNTTAGKDNALAPTFKKMLSRTDVRVHFVGVWDTVSSVGLMRPKKMLPHIAECCDHVCYFRHALALDERRVKFLPEYVHEGRSHTPYEPPFPGRERCTANIKEVWFAGTHSDVGGGNRLSTDVQLGDRPLLWMRNEAIMAGLHLKTIDLNLIKWKLIELERDVTPSLGGIWKILEYFPVRRLSYKGHYSTTRRFHRGKSRKIVDGQMIHASVIFRPGYKPSPAFPKNMGNWPAPLHWDDPDGQERLAELATSQGIWERDLFAHTEAKDLFERLKPDQQGSARILERIALMTSSEEGRQAISQAGVSPLNLLEPFLFDQVSGTSTEGTIIRISAATAFSYLIPSDLKDPDSKTHWEEMTGKLRDSGCLDLVISLISPSEEGKVPKGAPSSTRLIRDIEKAIKMEVKVLKAQQRAAQKQAKKRSKDPAPVEHTSPDITAIQAPSTDPRNKVIAIKDIANKFIARKAADDLQEEEYKLRLHACLAVATFVDHEDLREMIVRRNVLEALVDLVQKNLYDMSSVAAQALLHMLVSDGVAEYIVDKGLTEKIIAIALKEDTRVPVSAARILEELAEHDCTRKFMATSKVPESLFELLKAGEENFVKSSRLNALCKFSAYDDLRPGLLDIDLVTFLVKKAGRKDKRKRKACLAALITLARYDKMHAEILKAGFIKFLMKQLEDEDTDRDAQSTLVSLCTHEDFRSDIIEMDFLKILVHRLEKKKSFDDAQYSLEALIQYEDVRKALIEKLPFISTLEKILTKGGVILDDLGDAVFSFCSQHDDILQAIIRSRFVDILLDNARKGTMWGLEVASCLLQSDFLKIPQFRKKLMDGGLIDILNDIARLGFLFALTYLPAILSCTGKYDEMREAMLASDIIFWLTTRMRYVSISSVIFKENQFHPEIDEQFEEYGFDIDELDPVSLSLSRILRLGHENIHMIRSFLFMMATHPRGFRRMLKYGASDDW